MPTLHRTALVVGGSKGLGFALAQNLAKRDWNVFLVARDRQQLELAQAKLESLGTGEMHNYAANIKDPNARQTIIDETIKRFGKIDCLIAGAATTIKKPATQFSQDDFYQVFDLNVWAMMDMSIRLLAIGSPTCIVFISSLSTWFSASGYGLYSASKHALDGWAMTLRKEFPESQIYNFHPFRLKTSFSDASGSPSPASHKLDPEIYAAYMVACIEKRYPAAFAWWLRCWIWWISHVVKTGFYR